jgi:hypothetical protein
MNTLPSILRLLAPIFFLVAALHLLMGLGADALLGAELSSSALSDPVLDSQNRFYGVAFSLFGAVFYICSQDLERYEKILRAALWIFFAAGLARVVSLMIVGFPSVYVLVLLASELLLPPVLLLLLNRNLAQKSSQ